MSILQEYEEIRKSLTKKENDNIDKFLESHPEYLLSDVFYKDEVYQEFEKWQSNADKKQLNKKEQSR